MVLYHGSSIGGIHVLQPNVSEHKEAYVYLSSNPVVAAFYMVHIVEKPFSWFPYGFNREGTPVYTEYYPDALKDVYSQKRGYLYKCFNVEGTSNPTNIHCAYVSQNPVIVNEVIEYEDVFQEFMRFEEQGELIIQRHHQVNEKEQAFVQRYLADLVMKHKLKDQPESNMSMMIQLHFPKVWESI